MICKGCGREFRTTRLALEYERCNYCRDKSPKSGRIPDVRVVIYQSQLDGLYHGSNQWDREEIGASVAEVLSKFSPTALAGGDPRWPDFPLTHSTEESNEAQAPETGRGVPAPARPRESR